MKVFEKERFCFGFFVGLLFVFWFFLWAWTLTKGGGHSFLFGCLCMDDAKKYVCVCMILD